MYGVYSQQVNIMLLPSQKPSSSYSLLKFVYVTSQLHHPLEVYSFLRKILDSPLTRKPDTQVRKKVWPKTNKKVFPVPIFIFSWQNSHKWPSNHYSGYKGPENHSCKWPALFTHTFFRVLMGSAYESFYCIQYNFSQGEKGNAHHLTNFCVPSPAQVYWFGNPAPVGIWYLTHNSLAGCQKTLRSLAQLTILKETW